MFSGENVTSGGIAASPDDNASASIGSPTAIPTTSIATTKSDVEVAALNGMQSDSDSVSDVIDVLPHSVVAGLRDRG